MSSRAGDFLTPTYGGRWISNEIPKHKLAEEGLPPDVAYQLVRDELNLDGNPALNLATFVTTWMEPQAEKLIQSGCSRNLVDEDEYPQLKVIEGRLIRIQASLFNCPASCTPTGVCTIGSSEAIMLALLAHKWNWRKKRAFTGKDCSKPNIIFGADVHTCWKKFARYFDVEMRVIPMSPERFTISPDDVAPLIDENTIAVGTVLGTTFTGQLDDIAGINDLLKKHKQTTDQDIPIHVDAASGGFVVPFVQPDLLWDFRLEHVRSINVSNHKYGLVYAGLGSVIFRDTSYIPDDLQFDINYLGGAMQNFSLNFSRSSAMVLAQYYMFLRLGLSGYQRIMEQTMKNAHYLEQQLVATGHVRLLTDSHCLPVIVITMTDNAYCPYAISDNLRKYGWIVPAYSLPPAAEHTHVLRMVIKENFNRELAEKLLKDFILAMQASAQLTTQRTTSPTQASSTHGIC